MSVLPHAPRAGDRPRVAWQVPHGEVPDAESLAAAKRQQRGGGIPLLVGASAVDSAAAACTHAIVSVCPARRHPVPYMFCCHSLKSFAVLVLRLPYWAEILLLARHFTDMHPASCRMPCPDRRADSCRRRRLRDALRGAAGAGGGCGSGGIEGVAGGLRCQRAGCASPNLRTVLLFQGCACRGPERESFFWCSCW